ncbi:MAG: hypothetical protein QF380_09070, partial [Candidatus Marinimicrobia bacterium]|nr:hypothetical protein [Candidatus Neomarinimicrobiota bacterium]
MIRRLIILLLIVGCEEAEPINEYKKKGEIIKEPKILMIGRTQAVIDILIEELKPFGRNVVGSND